MEKDSTMTQLLKRLIANALLVLCLGSGLFYAFTFMIYELASQKQLMEERALTKSQSDKAKQSLAELRITKEDIGIFTVKALSVNVVFFLLIGLYGKYKGQTYREAYKELRLFLFEGSDEKGNYVILSPSKRSSISPTENKLIDQKSYAIVQKSQSIQ